MCFTLVGISILVFLITELLPGDVAQMILGQYATPEGIAVLQAKLGLDKPLYIRYFSWVNGIMHGDLGISLRISGVPVKELLYQKGINSLVLAGLSFCIIVPISIILGVIVGLKEGSWIDRLISFCTIFAVSLPEFISAVLLIYIFSLALDWLPPSSAFDPDINLSEALKHLILPTITLSFVITGYITRMVRSSVIEVMRSNYIRTAILKGLPRHYVIIKHALRNSLLPSITIIALNTGWLIGGLIVVESVFGYPGLGRLMLFAISQRDVPVIQATTIFTGAIFLFLNFVADLLYGFFNPRIKYE
jgi:peptide/nickel transport system permease protein